jgi:glyoxylase-like metal-dependent hydrolase (beta-lactamase superfamily II)
MSLLRRLLRGMALLAWAGWAASAAAQDLGGLQFALIKTGSTESRAGLAYADGSLLQPFRLNYIAVLVKHRSGTLLYDTGLGTRVDQQAAADSPWWAKMLAGYEQLNPARRQLDAAGVPLPARIFVSHAHWDHISALEDFPDAQVWITVPEREFLRHGKPPAVWPSQVASRRIHWKEFAFESKPVLGFDQTFDLFGDGNAVLVAMPGHTPGSTGLLLTTDSGNRYFFVGDTVWNAAAIGVESPKSWLGRRFADSDAPQVQTQIGKLRRLQQLLPDMVIVPAHDASVHDQLGYFPKWVK